MHFLDEAVNFCRTRTKLICKCVINLAKNLNVALYADEFLSSEQKKHLYNLAALLLPYIVVSFFIYPKWSLCKFLQEIFSLLCIYTAVFFWFMNNDISRYRIVFGITACAVPIIFLNNSFAVALVAVCFMSFAEFVCIEYMRGCVLFSNRIPVYVVCDDIAGEKKAEGLLKGEYKILDTFIADNNNFQRMKKCLARLNSISFFPFPRRLLYFSQKRNTLFLLKLLDVSSEFSIPLFKLKEDAGNLRLSPFSIQDFDFVEISAQEESMLARIFKNKRVWIFYDGRKCVLDLISMLSETTNVTVFCESEILTREIKLELTKTAFDKIYKVTIADKELIANSNAGPDILFFNMPLLRLDSCENNLKEAVVKNLLSVSKMAIIAQKLKIESVFMLSAMDAFDKENWIGATQRLGELAVQHLGSSGKTQTKFHVIRVPDCITDAEGLFDNVIASIVKGENAAYSGNYYSRDEIFHPLVKLIAYLIEKPSPNIYIYSVFSKNRLKNTNNVIDIVYKLLGLRIHKDARTVRYDSTDDEKALSTLENTDIDPAIMRVKLSETTLKFYEVLSWNIEEIDKMSARDIISSVFQSFKEKTEDNRRRM